MGLPGNWLGPEGHADLKNLVNGPSLYNLCSFPLKLFNVGAVITVSSLNVLHWFIIIIIIIIIMGKIVMPRSRGRD